MPSVARLPTILNSAFGRIQARDSVSRKIAIETYERVKEDMTAYPPGQLDQGGGPQAAAVGEEPEDENEAPEMPTEHEGVAETMGTASVVDGMKRAGAEAQA